MLYRVLGSLGPFPDGTVLPKGTVVDLSKKLSPKALKSLLDNKRVAEVQSPPLSILPGWKRRSKAFEEHGVITVSNFMEADLEDLSGKMNVSLNSLQNCLGKVKKYVT